MKLARLIFVLAIIGLIVFGNLKTANSVIALAPSAQRLTYVTSTVPHPCATLSDFNKVHRGQTVKKVQKIMHHKGRITHWELYKDSSGTWRLRMTYQFWRCHYPLSKKSFKVAFKENPDLSYNGITVLTEVRKYKLPL